MKQFNLKEYLENPSKKVITRNGKNVKIHCTNYNRFKPIVAEIEGTGTSYSFTIDGRFYNNDESRNDLFFALEKHEGWVNLYKRNRFADYITGNVFFNELEAKMNIIKDSNLSYINTIKIGWEE